MKWVGFDLGGTKMLAQVLDDELNLLGKDKRRTKAQSGKKAGIKRVIAAIDEALGAAELSRADIAGIGVGAPGPIDPDSGTVVDLPNMGWKNVELGDALHEAFGCPAVIVNDVDAGLYGEYRFGAAKGSRTAVGVFPGTGIGGGCVYEGNIVRGRGLTCMEIGHMQMVPDGPKCGCGKRGCLEAIASRLAIASAAAAAAHRGEAPALLAKCGTDIASIRSGALRYAIAGGDTVVEEIVRHAARWLGVGIGNVVNLVLPDVVVLGGGLVEAMPELFLEEVEAAATAAAMPVFRGQFRLKTAALGDDATVRGAAAWARHTVKGE